MWSCTWSNKRVKSCYCARARLSTDQGNLSPGQPVVLVRELVRIWRRSRALRVWTLCAIALVGQRRRRDRRRPLRRRRHCDVDVIHKSGPSASIYHITSTILSMRFDNRAACGISPLPQAASMLTASLLSAFARTAK